MVGYIKKLVFPMLPLFQIIWDRKLNKILELECDYYFYKIDYIDDKFQKTFYKQLMICAKEDLYELYVQIATKELEINKNNIFISQAPLRKMLLNYCYYNTVCFLKSRKKLIDEEAMMKRLYDIFGANEAEIEKFTSLTNIFNEYTSGFELDFSTYVLKSIFDISGDAPIFLAFIGNFFYNSYQGFMKSFTNYVPLSAIISNV